MEKQNMWFRPVSAILLIAAIAVGGCNRGQEKPGSTPVSLPNLPSVRFEAMNSDEYVDVYPGTTDSESDRTSNGFYSNARVRLIECQQTGRQEADSDVWYRLYRADGMMQFVSAGHVALLPPDATVPPC